MEITSLKKARDSNKIIEKRRNSGTSNVLTEKSLKSAEMKDSREKLFGMLKRVRQYYPLTSRAFLEVVLK